MLLSIAAGAGYRVALVASAPSVVMVLRLSGVDGVYPLAADVSSARRLLQEAPTA